MLFCRCAETSPGHTRYLRMPAIMRRQPSGRSVHRASYHLPAVSANRHGHRGGNKVLSSTDRLRKIESRFDHLNAAGTAAGYGIETARTGG